MATAPCDDCGRREPVPEDHPVDWTYCPMCRLLNKLDTENDEHQRANLLEEVYALADRRPELAQAARDYGLPIPVSNFETRNAS